MPISAAGIAGIGAGASILGNVLNISSQGRLNRQTREWNRAMYNLQRYHSLQDWYMQNQYNHPSSQMARLREAGINPQMVYKNGADAVSGPVRSTDSAGWTPRAPEVDLSGVQQGLMAGYDAEIKAAQVDNLRTSNTVMEAEKALKLAGIQKTMAEIDNIKQGMKVSSFDLMMKETLKDNYIEVARAGLNKTLAETKTMLDRNEREAASNSVSIQEGVARILKMREETLKLPDERRLVQAQIANIMRDVRLKELDINLKEKGIQPHDKIIPRIIAQNVEKAWNKIKNVHIPRFGQIKPKWYNTKGTDLLQQRDRQRNPHLYK